MEWNTSGDAPHRVGLGLACLARQGDRIVLATRGPASIVHAAGAGAVTLHEPDDEHAAPMDGLDPGQPQLAALTLAPGDRLLLTTTNVAEAIDEATMGAILAQPLDDILPHIYHRSSHLRDAAVLFVGAATGEADANADSIAARARALSEEAAVIGGEARPGQTYPPTRAPDAPETRPGEPYSPTGDTGEEADEREAFQTRLFAEGEAEDVAADNAPARLEEVAPAAAEEPEPPEVTPLPRPEAAEEAEAEALPRAVGESGPAPRAPSGKDSSFFRSVARVRTPPAPPIASHQTSARPVSELAADRRQQIAASTSAAAPRSGSLRAQGAATGETLVRPRDSMGGGSYGGGRRGRNGNGQKAAPAGGGFSPSTWLVALVITLLVAGIAAWATLPGLLQSDDETRLTQLIEEASREIAAASNVAQPDLRREAFTRAHGILLEAMLLEGGRDLGAELLQQAERGLAALDAITTPSEIRTIADLRGFGDAPIAARQLVVSETDAYLLDSAGAQVLAISLSTGKKAAIYAAGEETPLAPIAIAWADASRPGGAALLIADEGGGLWTWSETGFLAPVELGRPEGFGLTITDMVFADSSLYVLDAPAAAIYRFASSGAEFAAPQIVRQSPDLANARHLTVYGADIFTAGADGTVSRLSGELALALTQAGIDEPLAAAATPYVYDAGREIAILDASADRIVILGRDGVFKRQYRHDDLQGVTAFAMQSGYGYALSGEQLRRIRF